LNKEQFSLLTNINRIKKKKWLTFMEGVCALWTLRARLPFAMALEVWHHPLFSGHAHVYGRLAVEL
jgi:hypothetical protein